MLIDLRPYFDFIRAIRRECRGIDEELVNGTCSNDATERGRGRTGDADPSLCKGGYTPAEIRSFTNERLELIQAVINRHLGRGEVD
jgi:hypothetical protein